MPLSIEASHQSDRDMVVIRIGATRVKEALAWNPDTLNVFQTDSQPSSTSEQNNSEGLPAHLRQTSEQNDTEDLPAHLRQMFSDNISDLSDNQKSKFKNLLSEFADVFSKDDFDPGCLNSGVEDKIKTHDEIPVAEKFRRTPLQFQKQEQEYAQKLLKQGVIEPSVSEWSGAPVLVRKETGELRYCIDYRALNAKTYKDNYSLSLIEDCLDSLHGKCMICTLDHCSGYYQIPM